MAEIVKFWLDEIESAKKREKDFRKEGDRVIEIYSAKKEVPFNILYSNTETLKPSLYSAVPRPVVQRRYKDDDPLGKVAAQAGQRMLEFLIDTNIDGYETFDEGMKSAVLDGLLPGRGFTTIKYDADFAGEYKKSEMICVDSKSWNKCYMGYARKWSKVPWIAYEEYIDKDEAERLFGKEIAKKLEYTDDDEEKEEREENSGEKRLTCVYQIWDKSKKQVLYVSEHYKDGPLKEEDDPLELTGFYNCPKPIQFVEKVNDMVPVALYKLYENQATELNKISRRINLIVDAIKAKGIYDSGLGADIKNLLEADDNELVPAEESSTLAYEKGIANAIWMWPVEQLVNVLQQLLLAREQCKRVIYEITRISDILRGSSVASETATAQTLKSQWGTLSLKSPQKEVQRYARDQLRIMLEIAATKFSEETWAKMTGLPFLTERKVSELTSVLQALKMQAMQGPPTQPGQPPDPMQQQLQQITQQLQTPKWSDVLGILKDDLQRAYRIDIETNSTVEPEAVEDQKNVTDLMTALGQFLNGVGPLVEKGIMPFQVAQSMMLAISRRFRFGTEVEDYIKAMQQPAPQDDGKAAAEQQKLQMEQQRMQADQQNRQAEMQANAQNDALKHQRELESEHNKMSLEQLRIKIEADARMAEIQAEKEANNAKLQAERHTEQQKIQMQRELELDKAAISAAAQIEIAKINAAVQKETAAAQAQVEGAKEEKNDAKESAREEKSTMAITESLKAVAEALKLAAAPKRLVKEKNGDKRLEVIK
jgi:hypothetical protein